MIIKEEILIWLKIIRKPYFVTESKKADDLLQELQKSCPYGSGGG